MSRFDLDDWILALLDGELSPDEAAALEHVLRTDPDALETYSKLVAVHNALEMRFSGEDVLILELRAQENSKPARSSKRKRQVLLYGAAAVFMGVVALTANIVSPSGARVVGTYATEPGSTYKLTFENETKPVESGQLIIGSRLELTEGAFEGVFANGARLVAEAPLDFRVLARDRVAIEEGSVWFRVPTEARGFTAETQDLVVVDLGTEFGLIAQGGSPVEVHVLSGQVEARQAADKRSKVVLNQGMARQVSADGSLEEIQIASTTRFRRELKSFSGAIANFTFTGPPWESPTETDFATFARKSPSEDADPYSTTSILSNHGFDPGGRQSHLIRDEDIGTAIFSTSATPGVGMNLGGADQKVPTHYIAFTVTPESGYQTTFNSLSLYTDTHAANDEYYIELRAWDGRMETSLGVISHTTGPRVEEPVVFKEFDFTDFTSSRPVEFRLYAYGTDEPKNSKLSYGIRMDDIQLIGRSEAINRPF